MVLVFNSDSSRSERPGEAGVLVWKHFFVRILSHLSRNKPTKIFKTLFLESFVERDHVAVDMKLGIAKEHHL